MKKWSCEWPLRLGLGFVNAYAGYFLVTDPARYYKFVPWWLKDASNAVASLDLYLQMQGVAELFIAIGLWCWFLPKWCGRLAAAMLALEMTLILVFIGVDAVTFRNVGLAGAAIGLFMELMQSQPATKTERGVESESVFTQSAANMSRG